MSLFLWRVSDLDQLEKQLYAMEYILCCNLWKTKYIKGIYAAALMAVVQCNNLCDYFNYFDYLCLTISYHLVPIYHVRFVSYIHNKTSLSLKKKFYWHIHTWTIKWPVPISWTYPLCIKHLCIYGLHIWISGSSFPACGPISHWGRDKMNAISQTTFIGALSWMKTLEF